MDFIPILEAFGEPQTLALAGFVLAFVFGLVAQRSAFCTRSAVIDVIDRKSGSALPMWLLSFGVALISVQTFVYAGWIDVTESRFLSTAQSISGALIGGALFGVGMALARGCASRLLVLSAEGNFRAATTVIIMAVTAWFTYHGFLAIPREQLAGLASSDMIGGNDLSMAGNFSAEFGVILGAIVLAGAIWTALRARLTPHKALSGLLIGFVIALGWYVTYSLSQQVFEPIRAESLSFIRPSLNAITFIVEGSDPSNLSLDTGLIAGILAGAFFAAAVSGTFKVRSFGESGTPHITRYIAGGIAMGFGGILAGGCTIGAGFTGGSVLAISSIIGLLSMLVACGLTHIIVDRETRFFSANSPIPSTH